jgi:hypothetical protein
MADNPPIDVNTEWISAAEAARLLTPIFKSAYLARKTICKRAHAGLIRARADRFMVDERERSNFAVPKLFWWAEGEAALIQDWPTGDFDTWTDNSSTRLRAFGVEFSRADIEKMIQADQQAQISAASNSTGGELLPSDIIEKIDRTYLKAIAYQMNGCMREGWYDACAVMMRRLLETVIIEAYEHHQIADRIKDGSGNYFQLSELIGAASNEPQFPLTRGIKTILPKLRDIGHSSAHDRYFTARRGDIDKVAHDARQAIEQFLHHARLL